MHPVSSFSACLRGDGNIARSKRGRVESAGDEIHIQFLWILCLEPVVV